VAPRIRLTTQGGVSGPTNLADRLRQFLRRHRRAVVKRSPLGVLASLGIFVLGASSYKRVGASEMQDRITNRIYWNFHYRHPLLTVNPAHPRSQHRCLQPPSGRHGLSSCRDGSPARFECAGQLPYCHRYTNHASFELKLAAQPLRCLANGGSFPFLSLWKGSEELFPLIRDMTERALTRRYVMMSYYQMNGVSTCERRALQIPAATRRVIS
jgi:hypothetical protein